MDNNEGGKLFSGKLNNTNRVQNNHTNTNNRNSHTTNQIIKLKPITITTIITDNPKQQKQLQILDLLIEVNLQG